MDKWDSRFMEMAHVIAGWTSCYRPGRSIGCVIVKDKRIMTTGYNGAPAGLKTCRERGECMRDRLGIQSGTRAELCYAIHAEQNAIIQAAKLGVSIDGATLYCTHQPCSVCAKMIINARCFLSSFASLFASAFFSASMVSNSISLSSTKNRAQQQRTPASFFSAGWRSSTTF